MLKKILIILFLNIHLCSSKVLQKPIKALCIVPVADLIGEAFEVINPNSDVKKEYKSISISPEKGALSCARLHQLLFNEQVEIIEEYQYECKVNISTAFHQSNFSNKFNCTYCTLKENLIPIDKIESINLLPKPLNFKTTNFDSIFENTLTLILPTYDPITKKVYSVGTRFIIIDKNEQEYVVSCYDPEENKFVQSKIDKNFAIESFTASNQSKLNLFLSLLNLWTELDGRFIPYVWGGVSATNVLTSNNFFIKKSKNCLGNEISYIKRSENMSYPITGFDCSGLILQAAQIAHIPYFFKNTSTLAKFLKPLERNQEIENGDLIWFKGHVVIILNKQEGICVEARGYDAGFGKVHKIHINKLFKNVNSIDQLRNLYFNNSSLKLLNADNETRLYIEHFKILKLNSVWSWNKNNN